MSFAVLALPVSPRLKVTDKGLVDVHVRFRRVPVAVAIHGKTIHHIDIHDAFATSQIIGNGFSGFTETVKKCVLLSSPETGFAFAPCMYP